MLYRVTCHKGYTCFLMNSRVAVCDGAAILTRAALETQP